MCFVLKIGKQAANLIEQVIQTIVFTYLLTY